MRDTRILDELIPANLPFTILYNSIQYEDYKNKNGVIVGTTHEGHEISNVFDARSIHESLQDFLHGQLERYHAMTYELKEMTYQELKRLLSADDIMSLVFEMGMVYCFPNYDTGTADFRASDAEEALRRLRKLYALWYDRIAEPTKLFDGEIKQSADIVITADEKMTTSIICANAIKAADILLMIMLSYSHLYGDGTASICEDCGAAFLKYHKSQKYCTNCSKESSRAKRYRDNKKRGGEKK